ncbi:MAG: ParB/RepB/Spo0J family partition protein [Bacteroidota bacterium]
MAKPRKRTGFKKTGLGKSPLDNIIPADKTKEEVIEEVTGIVEIPVSKIEPNPHQPRTEFDPTQLEELSASIKVHGIIQPLTVRNMGGDAYQLIAGERRLRASKLAGLEKVPAYVRKVENENLLELALIENIQRQDLNPIEIALSYQRMIDELKLKQSELGDKVGKNRSSVTNYLRLLKLPETIQTALRDGSISNGHGRALISIDKQSEQMRAFEEVIARGLSVRQTEDLIRKMKNFTDGSAAKKATAKAASPNDIHLRNVARGLEDKFGSKVSLNQKSNGKGDISIAFNSTEDLNRILELLDL